MLAKIPNLAKKSEKPRRAHLGRHRKIVKTGYIDAGKVITEACVKPGCQWSKTTWPEHKQGNK